jgi:predicted DNA-binding transcriptional regulator YafY
VTLQAEFEDEEQACFAMLGMGARAEVIAPDALRERVRAGAAAVLSRYRHNDM